MASGYGYRTFGDLMCHRQTRSFVETVLAIRRLHTELCDAGVSQDYAGALASYAAATLCRRIRLATRGARLRQHGSSDGAANNRQQVGDMFTNEASVNFQFDYFEAGPGEGPGTWESVLDNRSAIPGEGRPRVPRGPRPTPSASATALPFRDSSVDAIITDPPYYDMIEYADASDSSSSG